MRTSRDQAVLAVEQDAPKALLAERLQAGLKVLKNVSTRAKSLAGEENSLTLPSGQAIDRHQSQCPLMAESGLSESVVGALGQLAEAANRLQQLLSLGRGPCRSIARSH